MKQRKRERRIAEAVADWRAMRAVESTLLTWPVTAVFVPAPVPSPAFDPSIIFTFGAPS